MDYFPKIPSLKAQLPTAVQRIKKQVESLPISLRQNWSANWCEEIRNSYLIVEARLKTGHKETYTQTPSMSGVDVLSNVGSQTGLWIGISSLSLMEIIEVLFRLARHQYHVLLRKIRLIV